MPPIALICQPDGYIDMTAAAMEEEHCRAVEIVANEEKVDAIILISVPPTFLAPESLAEEIIKIAKKVDKPLLTCLLAGKWVYQARQMLERAGLPTFDTPEQAVKSVVNMVGRSRYLRKIALDKGGDING